MSKKQELTKETHPKEYTPKELYEGYYWLILHTDPFHTPGGCRGDEGCIIISDYWKAEMPDCVKTVAEKHIISQLPDSPDLISAIIEADLTDRGKYFPGRNNIYSTVSIFNWFARMDIPRFTAEGADIKCWRGLRKLWRKINVVDSYGKEIPVIEADWFKEAAYSESLYHNHSEDIFNGLESYLEPQHKENLKRLAQLRDQEVRKLEKEALTAQEKETPEGGGKDNQERQKRNSVKMWTENGDVILTKTEADCLWALKDVVKEVIKNKQEYIRSLYITMKVWPGENIKGGNNRKYYWSTLKKKLSGKGYELPSFQHFPSRYEGYCLGDKKTPFDLRTAWLKSIKFPKDYTPPRLAVRANR